MFRRNFGFFRRLIVILFALYALISFIGPVQQRLSKDNEKAEQVQLVNFTACGHTQRGPDDIIFRITERIKCRNHSFSQSTTPFIQKNTNETFFLTHDLFNAVGLGNFMFMAATLFGLAESTGRKPFFADSHHHMSVFESKFPMLEDLSKNELALIPVGFLTKNVIEIKSAGIFDSGLEMELETKTEKNKNVQEEKSPTVWTLRGYFQSWKYFDKNREKIRQQFFFSKKVFGKVLEEINFAKKKFEKFEKKSAKTIVGIHVRRGDLLKPVMKKYGHTIASNSYLLNLTKILTKKFESTIFLVVSNDIPYCKNLFKNSSNIFFVEGNSAEVDMAILSLMDHLILSVGTFGWWGAYLSDAQEIYYYRHWPKPGSLMDQEYKKEDYFLDNWKSSD